MRHILPVTQVLEAELKDLHSRKMELVPERFYVFRDDAQILGNDRKIVPELLLESKEQLFSRPFLPFSFNRGLGVGGDGPIADESAEMIDSYVINQIELALHTADPPFIPGFLMIIPVIEGIAPQLSRSGEIIGRDSGNLQRIALRVKPEQLLVCPDIAVIDRHEDRDIADDRDVSQRRIQTQRHPLFLEQELGELIKPDLLPQLLRILLLRCALSLTKIGIPVEPAASLEMILQRTEECIIIKPSGFLLTEFPEPVAHGRLRVLFRGRVCFDLEEMCIRFLQQPDLELDRRSIVHLSGIPLRLSFEVFIAEQSFLFQVLGTDDIDLPGKRGQALIRGIAKPGRSQREHLPQMLICLLQKIDEITGALAQVTDPVRGRK